MLITSNQSHFPIVVIIATSMGRTELLLNRSLRSVYEQEHVNPKVVIVDDNPVPEGMEYSREFKVIKNVIKKLRETVLRPRFEVLGTESKNTDIIFEDYFQTILLKNSRTKGHSGTGAWNTAIYHLNSFMKDQLFYITFLDDDDEYKPGYLSHCQDSIHSSKETPAAVFTPITWRGEGFEEVHHVDENRLTQKEFFIGNPGVQGSNMCFRSDILIGLGGFDENLYSTTDRDLMIRFLDYLNEKYQEHTEKGLIIVLKEPLVVHHAYRKDRITNNKQKKKIGLDLFYRKYRTRFSRDDFERSLERASRLFGYEFNYGKIVIGMPLKNRATIVKQAVESVLGQIGLRRDLVLLIVNDGSSDDWQGELEEYLSDPRMMIVDVDLGKSYAVRNFIHDFVRNNIPDADYIGRLDTDDRLVDEITLSKIEERMDQYNPDVIIAGNKLSLGGKIIERTNHADVRLLRREFLKEKLFQMSKGIPEGELPSCNIFIKPSVDLSYKEKESAEDHWFTVDLLLKKDRLNIHIAEDLLYAIYSLDGETTKANRKSGVYSRSRKELYEYYLSRSEPEGT